MNKDEQLDLIAQYIKNKITEEEMNGGVAIEDTFLVDKTRIENK